MTKSKVKILKWHKCEYENYVVTMKPFKSNPFSRFLRLILVLLHEVHLGMLLNY